MYMESSLKEKILTLRSNGKTYDEIKAKLKCSKATISYHCKRYGINGNGVKRLSDAEKLEMNEYYRSHTIDETANYFDVHRSTIIKYVENKHVKLTDAELKSNIYNHVKNYRQRLKEKAIEYKGGKCQHNNCGYNKCNRALEFHHLDPNEKDFGISSYTTLSWDKIKKELDKCILVCANCHREIHDEIYNTGE